MSAGCTTAPIADTGSLAMDGRTMCSAVSSAHADQLQRSVKHRARLKLSAVAATFEVVVMILTHVR